MIAFRRAHPVLSRETFYTDLSIRFFNPAGETPDWFNPQKKCLGCLILGEDEPDLCMLFNAGAGAETFALPAIPLKGAAGNWQWTPSALRGKSCSPLVRNYPWRSRQATGWAPVPV
jgi:pullulanase/glycogen debranching enzyme